MIQVVDFDKNTAFPIVADPSWWAVTVCAGALIAFVGSNTLGVWKILQVKKYIAALGGFTEAAELMLKASTWEEKLREGGTAFANLAGIILGTNAIKKACF